MTESSGRGSPARRALALLAVQAAAFGWPHLVAGFYTDDWSQLLWAYLSAPDQSLRGLLGVHADAYWALRPLGALYYGASYWLGGLTAWKYQLQYFIAEAASTLLLFYALAKVSGDRGLAFLCAVLFCLYPNHGGARYWNNLMHPAQVLFAASMACWARGLERRSAWRTGLAAALFFACGLTYESHIPLVLLAPLLGWLRRARLGEAPRKAVIAAAVESWPLLAAGGLVVAFSVAVQKLVPGVLARKMVVDPAFIMDVLTSGLECSSTRILALFASLVPGALRDFGWPLWLAGAALIAAATWFTARVLRESRTFSSGFAAIWLLGCLGLVLAGYLPYGLSADRYVPHIYDLQNRLNTASALPAAMILGFLLHLLRRSAWAVPATAAVLACFLLIDWQTAREWQAAWNAQQAILRGISEDPSVKASRGTVSVLLEAPTHAGNAPIFSMGGEFGHAVKVVLGERFHGAHLQDSRLLERLPAGVPRLAFVYSIEEGLRRVPGSFIFSPESTR